MFPSALEKAPANIASALGSVKARQKISASAFELRQKLFRKLQLQFGIAAKFPKCAKDSRQTEGRSIFHHRGLGRVAQLFRHCVSILDLPQSVDQLGIERVLARKNAAVRNGVSQHIGRKPAFFRNNAEELVVSLHHETLDQILFFGRHRTRTVQDVLELATFENDRGESD